MAGESEPVEFAVAPSPLMAQVTVLHERPGNLMEAMVPSGLINREEVPVDSVHVEELRSSIVEESEKADGTGQLVPVLLGEVPGEDRFFIIDGFHRAASLDALGREEVFATIRPNCTLSDIYDLRILAANTSHPQVMFPRIVEWANEAWHLTPWARNFKTAAGMKDIKITQAITMTATSSSGKGLGLSRADADAIKLWVNSKCREWKMKIPTLAKTMRIAEIADRDLIRDARPRPRSGPLEHITPDLLHIIADQLPDRFEEQKLAAQIIVHNDMNNTAAREVATRLGATLTNIEAVELIEETDWGQVKAKHSVRPKRSPKGADDLSVTQLRETAALKSELLLSEIEFAKLALDNLVASGGYRLPPLERPAEDVGFFVSQHAVRADMHDMLAVQNSGPRISEFLDYVGSIRERVIGNFTARFSGLGQDRVTQLFDTVTGRIAVDMGSGDLRFVSSITRPMYNDLLNTSMLDEISRLQQADSESSPATETAELVPPLRIDLEQLTNAFPNLPRLVRRLLVLRGFYGLRSETIRAIIGSDPHANYYLSRPRQMIGHLIQPDD